MNRGEIVYNAPGAEAPSHTGKPLLFTFPFKTDLFSSNYVQGIYYSNYMKWSAQARDAYFFSLQPSIYTNHKPETGEFILLDAKVYHSLCYEFIVFIVFIVTIQITHVLEALPFDELVAKIFLVTEYEYVLTLLVW